MSTKRVHITLTTEIHAAMVAEAKRLGLSLSAYLTNLHNQETKRNKK